MIQRIGFYVIILFLLSCTKQEGEGGLNSIQGVVMIQNVNSLLEKSGAPYFAQDEKVYISYGENTTVDNDVSTSAQGNFIFQYLTPGNYSVFAYSDDTVAFNAQSKMGVNQQVSIKNKKDKVTLDTIIIYKHVDYNDGVAIVEGNLNLFVYFPGSTVIVMDTITAQDKDVFIQYMNDSGVMDKVATAYDGTYKFTNLIPGTYKIFVYDDDAFSKEDFIVSQTFTITEATQKIQLNPMYISKF
jgi:hypothetical protein